jgi:cytochrome c-type biogenesis protein CcmH/NrfG
MKNLALFIGIVCLFCGISLAQGDDETRSNNGLPSQIVPGRSTNGITGAEITGNLLIQGEGEPKSQPEFIVYLILPGNQAMGRQPLRNKSYYSIRGVVAERSTLVLVLNGVEFARYQIVAGSPATVRQDMTFTWEQINNGVASILAGNKNIVVSVKGIYDRGESNQKLYDKASANRKDKKYDEAISILNQIAKNDPNDFVVFAELGTLYFSKDKLSEAEDAYKKALELKPELTSVSVSLGKLYMIQKNNDAAVLVFTKALELDPKSADANQYLGETYLQAKKGSKAVGYLNEAIRLAPLEKAEIHLRLAALYNGANLKDKAIAEYKIFIEKMPNHPDKKKFEQYIKDNSPQ